LLSPKLISELSGLQFLELNLHTAVDVKWQDIAKLPALHSLMLVPPISPASMGQSPEHAQQVGICTPETGRAWSWQDSRTWGAGQAFCHVARTKAHCVMAI
jgi:hypothetical protein